MLAIIKTGGKQYLVSPKQKLKIEKLEGEVGKQIEFTDVLLFEDDKVIEIGKPFIKGAKVTATILKQDRAGKIIVFKYKAKKRQHTKRGHKQPYTEVEINEIIAA